MNFKQINLNHIYIILCLFFIFSVIIGHYENSYLSDSSLEIIILNVVFIFAVLNNHKSNIFLKLYFLYFFIYLINIYLIPLEGHKSHAIARNVPLPNISKDINLLSLHFLVLFILIKIIFRKNFKFSFDNLDTTNFKYIIRSNLFLVIISLISLLLITNLNFNYSFIAILSVVLSLDKILIIATAILFIFWDKLNLSFKAICLSIILICTTADFLNNSKSSIFYLFLIIIICFFYLKEEIYLNIKVIFAASLLFFISTLAYFFALNTLVEIKNIDDLIVFFFSFARRLAFFEFYLDKNNLTLYNDVMSLEYNLKSFVDKITPGFDPYGIPLMKNQLHYLWHYYEGIEYLGTVSEQSTLFAISNRVFGYYFIFYYLVVLYLFKYLFYNLDFLSKELKVICQITVCYLFVTWLDGFGIDYFLMIIFYYTIFLFILFSLTYIQKKI